MFIRAYNISGYQTHIKKTIAVGNGTYISLLRTNDLKYFIGLLNANFEFAWIKEIDYGDNVTFHLVDAIKIDNLYLYGFLQKSEDRIEHIVIRLQNNGSIVWIKSYGTSGSFEAGKNFLKWGGASILIYGTNELSSIRGGEILLIDLDGEVLRHQIFTLNDAKISLSALSYGEVNTILLTGHVDIANSSYGFVLSFPPPINMGEGFSLAFNAWPNVPVFSVGNKNVFFQSIEIDGIGLILGYDISIQKLFIAIFDFKEVSVPGDYSEYKIQYLDQSLNNLSIDQAGIYTDSENLYIWYLEDGNYKIIKLDFDSTNKKINGTHWTRHLDLLFGLDQIIPVGSNILLSGSYWNLETHTLDGILFLTDHSLSSCNTINDSSTILAPQFINRVLYDLTWWEVEGGFNYQEITGFFSTIPVEFERYQICPPPFPLEDSYLLQSPYLYLHTAGSTGQDSTAGIHLRWMLLRNLGETHLPKGNYAESDANFNKPDDFVRLFRMPYAPNVRTLNLQQAQPSSVNDNQRSWTYTLPNEIKITLHFPDTSRYQQVRNAINPLAQPWNFIQAYGNALIDLRWPGELLFAVDFELQTSGSSALQLETFSVQSALSNAVEFISNRHLFMNTSNYKIMAENMRAIRFRMINGFVKAIRFERYADLLAQATTEDALEGLGAFALTLDNELAFNNLEDGERGIQLGSQWKRFNETMYVSTQNYKKKWEDITNQENRIKYGVQQYIQLSDAADNPRAVATLLANTNPDENPDLTYPDTEYPYPDMEGSFLDMLGLTAMDYHIARMLGLGYIDTTPTNNGTAYIYLIEYHTLGELDDGGGARPVQHLFFSLPTRRSDQRLPLKPKISELSYGLIVQENTNTPIAITDENGYLPNGSARYIRLYTDLLQDFSSSNGFFQPAVPFKSAEFSYPVFVGMEYRKNSESNWRRPEIPHDQDYQHMDGTPETLPLPFYYDEHRPVLIHREEEEGIHFYAPYSINILSRASALGNNVSTNYTQFTKANTLLPPSNFRVQLIQPENPLLLTSEIEQNLLAALNGEEDKTLVRVTFNYTHIHDLNYDFANKVELFFRPEMPPAAAGRVEQVIDNGADAKIKSAVYHYDSIQDMQDMPTITPAVRPSFLGGYLSIGEEKFEITNITYDGASEDKPNIIVKKREERNVIIQDNGQPYITQTFVAPPNPSASSGSMRFTAAANMRSAESWGVPNPLATVISIGSSQWETRSDIVNGQEVSLRGIWSYASCNNPEANDTFYTFTFDFLQLQDHPQEHVEWFGGIVRVPLLSGERVELEVLKIVPNNGTLKLYAQTSSGENEIVFPEMTSLLVNFYPGYRVYLYAEGPLNENNILPEYGQGYKNSLIGARSKDTSNGYVSNIGIPAILMAQEIMEPVVPEKPTGPTYATPPDWYNKSTFTFSNIFPAKPFQIVYYRADKNSILNKLYEGEALKEALHKLEVSQEWSVDRWDNLLSFTYPNGEFEEFPAGSGDRLPLPNKHPFDENALMSDDVTKQVIAAIYSAFTPLTLQPLLYKEHIENNTRINALAPAKKISANNDLPKVRFTDFTLDGGMITAYFYCVRTIINNMKMSEPSGILGPIELINTRPPESPVVRKVTTQLADPYSGVGPAVRFEIGSYREYENIRKFNIYRSLDTAQALSVRTMELCKTVDLTENPSEGEIITFFDDFYGSAEIPFGRPIYYRLVALREVKYVDPEEDILQTYVPSLPTKILLSNVVDSVNPLPPVITPHYLEVDDELRQVKLSWTKTTYNGKYYLFKMNSMGNWNKLYDIRSNDPNDLHFTLSEALAKKDEDDNAIYHRFKVSVENSSGLLNLTENVLII